MCRSRSSRQLAGLLFAVSLFFRVPVHAQTAEVPDSLVLRFGEGSAELDQPAIREAVASELGIPVALEGSEHAATLTVERAATGEVRIAYRPAREALTRSVPVTAGTDVAALVAHLAGNMVRNEARELLAGMAPPPPTAATAAPPAPSAHGPEAETRSSPAQQTPPYLDDNWIFSLLLGGVIRGDEQVQLTLQLSRRLGRFEIGAGARFGYGRVDANVSPPTGLLADRVSTYQVTLPVSLEYRVLGHDEAYLQLGAFLGYRMAGIMNKSESVTSGSDGDVNYGLQATIGFRLAATNGLMARFAWDLAPTTHSVSTSDGRFRVDALASVVQIGWQIGF
jgi:hypothetical protein